MSKTIAVVIGSLRQESYNRKTAEAMMKMAPDSLHLQIIEIGELSLYNQDLDEDPPESWTEFRKKIKVCDGVLFFTPEYNRSLSGVLKNAIDIGSRPYGHSVWEGKPAGVVSVSPGAAGAFGANHHLRQCLVFLNCPVLQQPETYIGGASQLFNEEGSITRKDTAELLQKFITAYADWVQLLSRNDSR